MLPPLAETGSLFDMSQVESLNGYITNLLKVLDLLSQLLDLTPPHLVCVIDSFHVFGLSIKNTKHTRDLLCVIEQSLEKEHKVFEF